MCNDTQRLKIKGWRIFFLLRREGKKDKKRSEGEEERGRKRGRENGNVALF